MTKFGDIVEDIVKDIVKDDKKGLMIKWEALRHVKGQDKDCNDRKEPWIKTRKFSIVNKKGLRTKSKCPKYNVTLNSNAIA